ncbi:MAG: hypothetical protein Q4D33_03330 [Prevotellaceae bacterium]|nr:hypothetical protein [Prevotellaceae bacterium]
MKKIFSLVALIVAAFTFTSCEDVPMPYDLPGTGGGLDQTETIEPAGSGTAEDPFNVAAAIAKCKEVGTEGTTEFYYVSGVIKSVDTSGVAQYGNVNIDMIDEGGKEVFKAFQILGLNGAKFTDKTAAELTEGTTIVVRGQLVNYSGNTPETVGKGSAYIVSINGSAIAPEEPVGEAKGAGTADDPYNVAAAINICSGLNKSSTSASYLSDEVYVKGKIVSITDTELSSYGNITYYISDDGTTTGQLEVYRGFSFGGAKFTSLNDIKVGDEVLIKGKLQNWLGTYEFTQGSALVTVNGQGGGDNPGTEPGDEPGPGVGVEDFTNGDFEAWDGSTPVNWKSASTASSASLEQSTDAHGGSFAVVVKGTASANKRLAYKELTLEAGKYTFSVFAKATSSNVAQIRMGYVPVTDGTVGSYVYNAAYNDLSTEWGQYTFTFELKEKTTICLVVMNPKKSNYSSGEDVLIDDATFEKN